MPRHTDWFTDARFGMFIHWGIYAIPARGEWIRSREQIPDDIYRAYAKEFDPVDYNPRAWARLARRAGMKYAVMTTKHHDGFCLFDTALTDFKSTNTPARRDLIREYVDAFRAEGLRIGFYHSLLDWNHPDYPVADSHPPRNDAKAKARPVEFERYLDYLHGQVRELMTHYGRIDVFWPDFSYGEMSGKKWRATELLKMVRSLQPHIVVNNRLYDRQASVKESLRYGDYDTPEQYIPPEGRTDEDGKAVLWEVCLTLNDHWGYARDDHQWKSPAQVVRTLVDCVSKGGNLLLNVGPTARGEVPRESVEVLETVGQWMHANGDGVYGCTRAELPRPPWGRYTRKGETLYAHIFDGPSGPIVVENMAGKIEKARLVPDGSEVDVEPPWMMHDYPRHATINLPGSTLPDRIDTLVALELK